MVKNVQFHIATGVQWSMNGNFTLLQTSSDEEWQYDLATDI